MVNRKVIGLLGMAMAMSAMATSGYPMGGEPREPRKREDKSYLRKKCKSCKHMGSTSFCSAANQYTSPQHQACNKYKPKNK